MTGERQFISGAGFTSFTTGTGIFAIYFMLSSMTLAIPVITGLYNFQPYVSGFIIQAHLIGAVIFLLPAAKIGDLIGHENVLCIGGFFFAASSLLCAVFPPDLGGIGLIFFRFTQGIGDGMIMASSLVLLSRRWSPEKRGESFGFFLFSGYMGYIAGLLGGGALIDLFSWRAPFLFTVPMTIITGICGYMISKSGTGINTGDKQKLDLKGIALFAPAIVMLTAGLSLIPSTSSAYLIITGTILFIILVAHEKRSEYPLFKISLFKNNRIFSLAILSDILYYSGIGAISYLLSIYLEAGRGLGSFDAALVILPISVIQGVMSPVTGKVSDKIDPKYISSVGVSLIFIILLLYSQIDQDTSILVISVAAAITGAGFAMFSAPNKNAIMSSVKQEDHGNASGIANTFEQTGNLVSIGIAAAIMTRITGESASGSYTTDLVLKSTDIIFIILAVICLVNIAVILIRGKIKKESGIT